MEKDFTEHKNALLNLKKEQILSVQEILNLEKDSTFGIETISQNKTCSFRISYISSYLFVRGCMETIAKKFNLKKEDTIQRFLEIVRESECINEWMIFDIADALDLSRE